MLGAGLARPPGGFVLSGVSWSRNRLYACRNSARKWVGA